MNKIVRFLILPAILSLSCSLMNGLITEPGLVEATGPILDMTVAASLDDQGQPVDAAFTYPADQPEMVVLVRVGEVTPGPLTFSWYQVTDAGDEALFEQTVAVKARDVAFSTGLNPGILAAGTYKVVATFAGQSETIAWDVAELQPVNSTAPVGTSASTANGTPAPGPSGTTPAAVPQPGTQNVSGGTAIPLITRWNAPPVKFLVMSGWNDAQTGLIISPKSFKVQVSAAITGLAAGQTREFTHPAGTDVVTMDYSLNPCTLPGGSDLPGTSITVTAVALGYGQDTNTEVLGADSSAPTVQLVSEPSNGAKVEVGNTIVLSAIAEEKRGGSWQTGVSKIEIFVMEPTGEELLIKKYDEYQDRSCDDKSWKQTTEEKIYTVPEGVKGDIRICAFGYDFAGNIGKKCYTYHTGNQLKGKLTHSIQQEGPSGAGRFTLVYKQDADLSLILEPGGTLSGTAQIDYLMDTVHFQSESCGNVREWVDPIQLTLAVTGTWTEDAIDFHYTTDAPIMVPQNFKAIPDCGGTDTMQLDVSYLVGLRYHADWDGQAYTADEMLDCSDAAGTCEWHWTIHLEPPAPAVGFNPGLWMAASCDQASVDLTYP